jgi:hypothetical protein
MTELEKLWKRLDECANAQEREAIMAAIDLTEEHWSDWMKDSGAWER